MIIQITFFSILIPPLSLTCGIKLQRKEQQKGYN